MKRDDGVHPHVDHRARLGRALLGLVLMLATTGCQRQCELEDDYSNQLREAERVLDDARDEFSNYQRFIVEESPGVLVVNAESQKEALRSRVRAYLADPDHQGDVQGVFGDPLVALYRDRWDAQVQAFRTARTSAQEAFGELETVAVGLNGAADEINQDESCGDVDVTEGWALYDQYRELRRSFNRSQEVQIENSAEFIAQVVAEWQLEQGNGEPTATGNTPPPGVDLDLFDPETPEPAEDPELCRVGGYLIGRATQVNGHALVVHTQVQFHCSEQVRDASGQVIGFVSADAAGNLIVVDNSGQVLDIPVPECEPDADDRILARQDAMPQLLEELKARIRENPGVYGTSITGTDGTSITVDELTVDYLWVQCSAERIFEVCEDDWSDPVRLAELRADLDRQLAAAVGIAPAGAGEGDES